MIKTPQTHPDHHVVGKFWGAHSFKNDKTAVYYCDSYDSDLGYWMTNILDHTDRRNISERAPWATYWPAEDKGTYFWVTQWGVKVPVLKVLCKNCKVETYHEHFHDCAHGIRETHMVGSERFKCGKCAHATFASSPDSHRFPFNLDKPCPSTPLPT